MYKQVSSAKRLVALSVALVMVVTALVAVTGENVNADNGPDVTYKDNVLTITFNEDYTGTININNYSEYNFNKLIINGNNRTLKGSMVLYPSSLDIDGYSVEINDLHFDGSGLSDGFALHSMNQKANSKGMDIKISGCEFSNYTSKSIYLTNATNVVIENCTIENGATVPKSNDDRTEDFFKYYDRGDYSIDIDITGVSCTGITINNVKFIGKCGCLGAVKIAQRGGAGDADKGTASITGVELSNLDFSELDRSTTENTKVNDIVIGSEPDVTGDESSPVQNLRDYNSAFPVNITASGNTQVSVWGGDRYGTDNLDIDLTSGSEISIQPTSKTGSGAGNLGGSIDVNLVSGSATLSGNLGPNMSYSAEPGTSTVISSGFTNTGGNAVDIPVTPAPGDDDDEFVPPYIPSGSSDDDDDTTLYIACCAAAAVVALLAIIIVMNEKKR